jgi:hypothetical protein
MKRLWATLVCLALLFAAPAHATAFTAHPTAEPWAAATVATLPAGHVDADEPAAPGMDRGGWAEDADGGAGDCTINAIIAPFPLVAAPIRRLGHWREATARLKRNALAPEPPPPIALS